MQKQEQTTPTLRFSDFKDDWVSETLGNYFNFKNGVNADKSAYGRGHKFINVLDIISDIPLAYDRILDSVDISDDEFKKNEVLYGDILFQRSSETREEVGQSNVYIDAHKPATFGGFVIRGRPIKEQVPLYFHYLLKTTKARKDMTVRSGGSTRYNIGQESLSEVSIDIAPTLQEQQKIAEFLGTVDEKITQLQKKKSLLENYKKGCMQKLFSQEIRFKDDNGNSFLDWEEKRLNQIATKTASIVTADSLEGRYGNYPVYGASGIAGYIDSYASEKQHISIVKDGAGVGRVFLCPERSSVLGTLDSIIGQSENQTSFIYYWLSQLPFRPFITGSTIPHIYFRDYGKKRAKFPHSDEQKKIADFLSMIDNKITLVSEELDKAQTFKKGLLQQMFV